MTAESRRIYLDHNASSPPRPEVREAVSSFLDSPPANPSSIHGSGRRARRAIDDAREEVARLLGGAPSEIVFTSGGTEANQLAWNAFRGGKRFLTARVEHPAVLGAAEEAEQSGSTVARIGSEAGGSLVAEEIDRAFSAPADLVSIQHANNETGVVHPIHALAEKAKKIGARTHTDAVQSVGKTRFEVGPL